MLGSLIGEEDHQWQETLHKDNECSSDHLRSPKQRHKHPHTSLSTDLKHLSVQHPHLTVLPLNVVCSVENQKPKITVPGAVIEPKNSPLTII